MDFPPPALNVTVLGDPPPPPPPAWVLIGSGEFVDSVRVFDVVNSPSWSLQTNLAAQAKAYGDRDYPVATVPSQLLGGEWISTSMETRRNIVLDTIVKFKMKKDGTVSIAYEDRVATKPAWLADGGFTATNHTMIINDGQADRVFTVYEGSFTAGQTVWTGANSNDGTSQALMYLIAITDRQSTSVLINKAKITNNALNVARTGAGLRISYTVKDGSNVRIDLFDIKGNKVRTLVNASRDAGAYRDYFTVDGLPNGFYLVRMNAGKTVLRQRVLIMR
jgi:hypothetical protein